MSIIDDSSVVDFDDDQYNIDVDNHVFDNDNKINFVINCTT